MKIFFAFLCCFVFFGKTLPARADYQQRLSLGAGVIIFNNPSGSYFDLGAEYEYRVSPFIGLGVLANYIFSSPAIVEVGAPDFFLHPFGTEFLINASPLVEFGSGISTQVGVRVGTRLPIPLGPINLIPLFSVDLISGGPYYNIGLGIEF